MTAAEPVPARPKDIPVRAVDARGAMRILRLGRTTIPGLAGAGQLPRPRVGRGSAHAVASVEYLVERMRSG